METSKCITYFMSGEIKEIEKKSFYISRLSQMVRPSVYILFDVLS